MTLLDPRNALAEQSAFIAYLTGLAGIGHIVRDLAEHAPRTHTAGPADDVVDLLLGLASLGAAIERLAPPPPSAPVTPTTGTRWLR
ncbi:hypothetical protein E4P42_10160 [Mycobacterium sp. PS03-16]|uniref:hypothetical protein n=1 Tax=Mycobacterium sp. PS03-16 TaxID=2559611 RepID=UPI00107332D8|nr:hypothetical protein [Mycobacterium sp. PS03-16]TFV58857.1 hypothetical protein E4P42_10160 [Mycobacterium sp. PS03-16]